MSFRKKDYKNLTTEFNGVNKYFVPKSLCSLQLHFSVSSMVFIFIIICFNLVSCSSQKLAVQEIKIERDGQVIAVVKAEIARTEEERQQGLMYRKKLPDGEGMLFIFERDQILSFWMKNTYIPLSIAYIAYNGRIIDIKDMYPHNETPVISSRSARYALEVPQGWFSRVGVMEGDVVVIND